MQQKKVRAHRNLFLSTDPRDGKWKQLFQSNEVVLTEHMIRGAQIIRKLRSGVKLSDDYVRQVCQYWVYVNTHSRE